MKKNGGTFQKMLKEIYFPTIPDSCASILFFSSSVVLQWSRTEKNIIFDSRSNKTPQPFPPVVMQRAEEQAGDMTQQRAPPLTQ